MLLVRSGHCVIDEVENIPHLFSLKRFFTFLTYIIGSFRIENYPYIPHLFSLKMFFTFLTYIIGSFKIENYPSNVFISDYDHKLV